MTRVISGTYKGRKLLTPEGRSTRPTTDRCKEALFGMLQFDLAEKSFLDLFAGSGQIGIEALSRGASSLDLVESDRKAQQVIRQNLSALGLLKKAHLWPGDVERVLTRLKAESRQFDLIFMDPPYQHGWEDRIGRQIAELGLLTEDGMLIVESSSETEVEIPLLEKIREKTYKTTRYTFFVRKD